MVKEKLLNWIIIISVIANSTLLSTIKRDSFLFNNGRILTELLRLEKMKGNHRVLLSKTITESRLTRVHELAVSRILDLP